MRKFLIVSLVLFCSLAFADKQNIGISNLSSDAVKVSKYFLNDLTLALGRGNYARVKAVDGIAMQTPLPQLAGILKKQAQNQFFIISSGEKNNQPVLVVRYIDLNTNSEKFFYFKNNVPQRNVSMEVIKKVYNIDLFKKTRRQTVVFYKLRNLKRNRTYDYLGELFPSNIGNALQRARKNRVIYSYRKRRVFKKLKLNSKKLSDEDILKVTKELKGDVAISGTFVIASGRAMVNIYITDVKSGEVVYSLNKAIRLNHTVFNAIERMARTIVNEIKRTFPPEPPRVMVQETTKVVTKEKVIKVRAKVKDPNRLYVGAVVVSSAKFDHEDAEKYPATGGLSLGYERQVLPGLFFGFFTNGLFLKREAGPISSVNQEQYATVSNKWALDLLLGAYYRFYSHSKYFKSGVFVKGGGNFSQVEVGGQSSIYVGYKFLGGLNIESFLYVPVRLELGYETGATSKVLHGGFSIALYSELYRF